MILTLFLCIAFVFYAFRISIHISLALFAISVFLLYFFSLFGPKFCALHATAGEKNSLFKSLRLICISFIFYALTSVFSQLQNEGWTDSWRFQESFLKFAIFAALIFLFFRLGLFVHRKIFITALIIGGIANSTASIATKFLGSSERVSLFNGIFQFSYFSAIICIISFNFFLHERDRFFQIIFFITATLCAFAVVLGASRGILLGLFFAIFYTILMHCRHEKKRQILKKLAIFAAVTIAPVLLVPKFSEGLLKRASEISNEAKNFEKTLAQKPADIDDYGSVGLRFLIWDNAFTMWKMSPIFGMNVKMRREKADEILKNTHFKAKIPLIGEAHNEILNALAKNGIIGLLGLVFMICSVIFVFLRRLNESPLPASCMLSIVALYVIDGFFNTPLDSKVEASAFFICVIAFVSMLYRKKCEA